MAAPPSEFFALRLKPGETIPLDLGRDFVITNVCFADPEEGDENAEEDFPVGQTTVVKVHHIAMDGPGWGDDDDDDDDDDDEDDDDEDEDEEEGGERADSQESGDTDEKQEKKEAKEVALNGSIQASSDSKKDAALEDEDDEDEDDSLDFSEIEEKVYSLCRLTTGRIEQATIHVQISAEELISLSVSGKNAREVDVLGTYLASPGAYNTEPDDDELYDSEEEDSELEDEDDEDVDLDDLDSDQYDEEQIKALRKALALDEDDDDEDDDDESGPEVEEFSDDDEDEDEEGLHNELAALLNGEVDDDDDDEDADEEGDDERFQVLEETKASRKVNGKKRPADDDEDEDEEMADDSRAAALDAPVTAAELHAAAAAEGIDISKLSKNQRKRLNKKLKSQGGDAVAPPKEKVEKTAAAPAKADAKVEKKAPAAAAPAAAAASGKKTTLAGGLVVEDKKTGTGPQAKSGQKVSMRYIGKFKDGKIFDSNTKGAPFTFRLGKGEVIKGWDIGVAGMTVGSERRLTVPPALGYGSKKTGPIPANSTLIFDVKLVAIK